MDKLLNFFKLKLVVIFIFINFKFILGFLIKSQKNKKQNLQKTHYQDFIKSKFKIKRNIKNKKFLILLKN